MVTGQAGFGEHLIDKRNRELFTANVGVDAILLSWGVRYARTMTGSISRFVTLSPETEGEYVRSIQTDRMAAGQASI
ncbi:hypothetical protein ACFFQF_33650 [Haladaptatus pallidirubidus]|uniref:Uncharacterized protein n=1 Tax=Haladaptatus pallidirubidus TaxID=1008152 RepID=A0AAV3UPX2_9EURY|nr:hypothetical protein [Haladaptatus pallidirubidus]